MSTSHNQSCHPLLSDPSTPFPKHLQAIEDGITKHCEDLISSLPKYQGWLSDYYYKYQGFWCPWRFLKGTLTCQQYFKARDNDLLLITSPKSGTTWLKALVYALVNRKMTQTEGGQDHPLLTTSPHDLVPFLELNPNICIDPQVSEPHLSGEQPSTRVLSAHIPAVSLPVSVKETGCKVVYLCREPKDTFISMWHFINNLEPGHGEGNNKLFLEAFDKFCKGVSTHGPFWDHVLGYWKYSLDIPSKVIFLKYEDLKEQPKLHLKRLAEFCGCPISEEEERNGVVEEIIELCSFNKLSNLKVNKSGELPSGDPKMAFFRKGEVGDWRNYLSQDMIEQIDSITREKFHPWGLKF